MLQLTAQLELSMPLLVNTMKLSTALIAQADIIVNQTDLIYTLANA